MKFFKVTIILSFLVFSTIELKAYDRKYWINKFEGSYHSNKLSKWALKDIWNHASGKGSSSDFYALSEGLDALTAAFLASGENSYIDDAIKLSLNIVNNSQPSNINKKVYKGWISKANKNNYISVYNNEVVLYESYFYRYLSKLLFVIKNNRSLLNTYNIQYKLLLNYLEKNGWEKWQYNDKIKGESSFLRSRTHMSAHWGITALFLSKITLNSTIKKSCNSFLTVFNDKLRNNFINPNDSFFIWNSTWNNNGIRIIQDVSHGNSVVTYIIESYELNFFWNRSDITKLCNLAISLYNKKNNTFFDTLNKTPIKKNETKGIYQADGWVKLGRYDKNLYLIYERFSKNITALLYKNQHGQYFANMALNAKYLNL